MAKHDVVFTIQVPGTADLKPPAIEVNISIEMDVEEQAEQVKWEYIKKFYEKEMKEKMQRQADAVAVPLASMQKDIDKLTKSLADAKKAKSIAAAAKALQEVEALSKALEKQIAEYNQYLVGVCKNIQDQQYLAWHGFLIKAAEAHAMKKIKDEIRWKQIRHGCKVFLKGALIVGAAALAIAASIVTFGGAAAVIAVIGVVAASIGGVTAIGKTVKLAKDNCNLETAALEKIAKDLKDLEVHMGKVSDKNAGLPKHISDATRFHSLRKQQIKEIRAELKEVDKIRAQVESELVGTDDFDIYSLEALTDRLVELQEQKDEAEAKLAAMEALNSKHEQLLKDAEKLVGSLSKLPVGEARTIGDQVDKINLDNFLDALDSVNAVVGNSGGLAGGLK